MHIHECEKYPSHTAIQNHKGNSDTVPCYPTIIQTFLSSEFDHQSLPEILWAHLHHLTVGLLKINTGKTKQHTDKTIFYIISGVGIRFDWRYKTTKRQSEGFAAHDFRHRCPVLTTVDIRKRTRMNLKSLCCAADVYSRAQTHTHHQCKLKRTFHWTHTHPTG